MAERPIKKLTLENGDKRTFIPIPATETEYGGIKASGATEKHTQEVRIGSDGKLYSIDVSDSLDELKQDITNLLSCTKENARYHLGFYLDENGELCEVEE